MPRRRGDYRGRGAYLVDEAADVGQASDEAAIAYGFEVCGSEDELSASAARTASPGRDEAPAEGTDELSASTGAQPRLPAPVGRSRPFTGPAEPAVDACWMQWAGPPGTSTPAWAGHRPGGDRSIDAGPSCIRRPPFGSVWCSPATSRRTPPVKAPDHRYCRVARVRPM